MFCSIFVFWSAKQTTNTVETPLKIKISESRKHSYYEKKKWSNRHAFKLLIISRNGNYFLEVLLSPRDILVDEAYLHLGGKK